MKAINTTGYSSSASNVVSLFDGSDGRAPRPGLKKESIVEAERRGNLVIASLAFCVLGGVVAIAAT